MGKVLYAYFLAVALGWAAFPIIVIALSQYAQLYVVLSVYTFVVTLVFICILYMMMHGFGELDRKPYQWARYNMKGFACAAAAFALIVLAEIIKEYEIPVTLLCDTNHVLYSDYSEVVTVGAGADAVDFKLVSLCHKGDIVVTQDYGVAAMILGKGAYGINKNGKWYTNENIDRMLMERQLAKKARNAKKKHHLKGPSKRTDEDDRRFAESFTRLVEKRLKTEDEA